jgi:GNAT superfamily N-acetyltransferase
VIDPVLNPDLTVESDPAASDIRVLEERLYQFNVQATGISDGALFGVFLRQADGAVIGGADGWTWGGTCYVRHLFVPAPLRKQGHGARLMAAVEAEARARGCEQMILETYDFQAPGFYRKLGFVVAATVEQHVRGHHFRIFVKRLDAQPPPNGDRADPLTP